MEQMRFFNCTKLNTNYKRDFTFIDLFAGIGGMRLGFEYVGGRCVFSSEIDYIVEKIKVGEKNEFWRVSGR